ncbi:MAG: VOC family protein [Azospirillaceae bacterium]|nr:VOC family protein [Azospirillaceae bacterium]
MTVHAIATQPAPYQPGGSRPVDHMVVRVGDLARSRDFYGKLFGFLGFEVIGDYANMVGWCNPVTRFWISAAKPSEKPQSYRLGDAGLRRYAFELRCRRDVDALQSFLTSIGAEIVAPAGEEDDDLYAVHFRDPDGMRLEGMTWGKGESQAVAQ